MSSAGADRRAAIQATRHFNRYYTNKLGLLGRYHFVSRFTLTEARVMLEIGRRGQHTQSGLCADLAIGRRSMKPQTRGPWSSSRP